MVNRTGVLRSFTAWRTRPSAMAALPRRTLRLELLESRHLLSVTLLSADQPLAPQAAVGAPPVSLNEIRGVAWHDVNGDRLRNESVEPPLAGQTVYLDANQNGRLDLGETSTTTAADDPATTDVDETGTFAFLGLSAGVYHVREVAIAGWEITTPLASHVVELGVGGLQTLRASLNQRYTEVTGLIPNRYDFSEGVTGTSIVDGGRDMYDVGNILNTDLASAIPYTAGNIVPGDGAFGPGSTYFTAKFPGLFVLAATNATIDHFETTGATGTNGAGVAENWEFTTEVNGRSFIVFARRVYGAGDPSIHHLMIVPLGGQVSQSSPSSSASDQHRINELAGAREIYYLLVSRQAGAAISYETTVDLANAFLAQVPRQGTSVSGVDFGSRALGKIDGYVWHDRNEDGHRDVGEPGLIGWTVYADANGNAALDVGESVAISRPDDLQTPNVDEAGYYAFTEFPPGSPTIRVAPQSGWSQSHPIDDPVVTVGRMNLALTLPNLHASQADIVGQVPTPFGFSQGGTGREIVDGGNHMYEVGNRLNTDRASSIEYANGFIRSSNAEFGPGSQYVSVKYSGLFLLAAANIDIDRFEITGRTGTVAGSVDGDALPIIVAGKRFTVYVKRVFGGTTPAVHHIVIVPGDGAGITHSFPSSSADDRDSLTGLRGVDELYYLLVSRPAGGYLTNTAILQMARIVLAGRVLDGLEVTGVDFGQRGTYSISGTKFRDVDGDATRDAGEPGLAGWTIFLDDNNNAHLDAGEMSTVTRADDPATTGVDEAGEYLFDHLPPGSYRVREVRQPGWQQRFPEAAHQVNLGSRSISALLANLDAGSGAITSLVPNRFDFSDGETGYGIDDGGSNMYDGGNYLYTSAGGSIPYSNRTVATNSYFGAGSQYFTAKYPGLFVLAAVNTSINYFQITGDLGADGQGQMDYAALTSNAGGKRHTVFVKRVSGAGVPSVNHLVIVPGDGTNVSHTFESYTNYDHDYFNGLSNVDELYYLLVSRQSGGYLTDADAQSIADEFLSLLPPPTEHASDIDFGNARVTEISGAIWRDENRDGVRDGNEAGLSGWGVYLDANNNGRLDSGERSTLSAADDPATAGVNESGVYTFLNVPPGTYAVRQVVFAGWSQTHPEGAATVTLTLDEGIPGGNVALGVDFGNTPSARIEGIKWNDLDGDGTRDADEPGLAGWTIYVDENNNSQLDEGEPTAVTRDDDPSTMGVDETGAYVLEHLVPSSHIVREVHQPGWQQRFPVDSHQVTLGRRSLSALLTNLDAGNIAITSRIPNRFNFSEGETGNGIDDGGANMYDGGNYMYTDSGGTVPYSNRIVSTNTYFGSGSQYFTAKYSGLFVLAAVDTSINFFQLYGDLGADGQGQSDATTLTSLSGGQRHTVFVKRVFGTGVPSVNHLIIVPGDGTNVSHTYETYTNYDSDYVSGLSSVRELYYLLVSRQSGGYLSDADAQNIADAFLALLPSPTDTVSGVDFGNMRVGEVRGVVWRDQNRDAMRGAGEPGLAGFTVYLDANDNAQFDAGEVSTLSTQDNPATTDVDETGMYEFVNVPLGSHIVRQVVPVGWSQTKPTASHNVTLAVDEANPSGDIVALDVSFGNAPDGRIEGVKWNDLDNDGVRDGNEPGMAGWTIYVDENNDGTRQPNEPSAVTAADDPATIDVVETGRYAIGDLPPGVYHVREVAQTGWQQRFPEDSRVVNIGANGLPGLLANLDERHTAITARVPTRFDFSEGETSNNINDGGGNMYDRGNYLYSSFGGTVPYSNRNVSASAYFGSGSQYFTAKYPGLFVLAAVNTSNYYFQIGGDLGADGQGQTDTATLTSLSDGKRYTVFVKRVFGAGVPSVNHLVIVPGDGTNVSHSVETYTNYDGDYLNGLSNTRELYYLLVSRQAGGYLSDADAQSIADEFLALFTSVSHVEGIDFGNRETIPTAEIRGVAWNDTDRDGTRDSSEPLLAGWTIYLDANQNGQLDDGESRVVTSADDPATVGVDETGVFAFTGLAGGTYRVAQVDQSDWIQTAPPITGGQRAHDATLSVGQIAGNFDFGNRRPAADVELRGAGHIIDDGDNSPAATDGTDFGVVEIGTVETGGDVVERTYTIVNVGESLLTLSGTPVIRIAGANAGDFTVTSPPPASTLNPGASTRFTVRFAPGAVGLRTARIEIGSDDIDEGTYDFAIGGTGYMPNIHAVDDLFTGAVEDTAFTTFSAGAVTVVPLRSPGWAINDELLRSANQYPSDADGRQFLDLNFDINTSRTSGGPSAWDYPLTAPFDCTQPNCSGAVDALTQPKTNVHVPSNTETTFLARRVFTLDAGQAIAKFGAITYTCDSGCIFYINGVYAGSSPNMAGYGYLPGPNAFAFDPGDEALPHETINIDFNVQGIRLFAGNNVLAVETHNDSTNSSDIGFDASLSISQTASGLLLNDLLSGAVGAVSITIVSQPVDELNGAPAGVVQLTDQSGNFSFIPRPDFAGRARFDYRIDDATSFSVGRAIVDVAPRNDSPITNADDYAGDASRPLAITTAGAPLVEANDGLWYYVDDGSDQDTLNPPWRMGPAAGFDPAAAGWKGPHPAQLGFGENDEHTAIHDAGGAGGLTYYFFTTFDTVGAPRMLVLDLKRDDGAAVYINGVEVITDNLPTAHPFNIGAVTTVQDDGQTFQRYLLDVASLSLLPSGNTLAVEVHQVDASSSDVTFDLRLFDPDLGLLANDEDVDDLPSALSVVNVVHNINPATQGTLDVHPDGTFVFTAANSHVAGTFSFTYQTQDAGGNRSSPTTVTLAITAEDVSAFVAVDDTGVPAFTTNEDTPLVIDAVSGPSGQLGVGVLANDQHPGDETDPVTLILVSPPQSGGTVVFDARNNGAFTYTPGANFDGIDGFAYRVHDGFSLSNVATVSIIVHSVDDPPVARDDSYTTSAHSPLTVDIPELGLLANDADADGDVLDSAMVVVGREPRHGTLLLQGDGTFSYQSEAGFVGTDTFDYTVAAGGLRSAPAVVTITVAPEPTGPTCADADLDGNGRVDSADLARLVHEFGRADTAVGTSPDFDGDGVIGLQDVMAFQRFFGMDCAAAPTMAASAPAALLAAAVRRTYSPLTPAAKPRDSVPAATDHVFAALHRASDQDTASRVARDNRSVGAGMKLRAVRPGLRNLARRAIDMDTV